MIQYSTNNLDFIKTVKEISGSISANAKKVKLSHHRKKINLNLINVGCDEAGRRETFGSLFLGCALIKKRKFKIN
jgi:ribonuclease HIII